MSKYTVISLPNIIPPVIDIILDHLQGTLTHLLISLLQQRPSRRHGLLYICILLPLHSTPLPDPLRHPKARIMMGVVLLEFELPVLIGRLAMVP